MFIKAGSLSSLLPKLKSQSFALYLRMASGSKMGEADAVGNDSLQVYHKVVTSIPKLLHTNIVADKSGWLHNYGSRLSKRNVAIQILLVLSLG